MTVATRSQTNSKMTTRASKKALIVAPKKKPIKKSPKNVSRVVETPKLKLTFMTQEEFEQQGYEHGPYGGYVNSRLITAHIPKILASEEDDIYFGKYEREENYYYSYKHDNKHYVAAPEGYFWSLNHVPYAGWFYDLEKL